MNVIVPKLEYAEVWEGNAKLVKHLETVQMTEHPKKYYQVFNTSTPSNTSAVLSAELGIHPPKTIRDVRKLKWRFKVRNMPKNEVASQS